MDVLSHLGKLKKFRKMNSSLLGDLKNKIASSLDDLRESGFQVHEGEEYLLLSPYCCTPESFYSKEEAQEINDLFFKIPGCELSSAFILPHHKDSIEILTQVRFSSTFLNSTHLLEFVFSNFSFGERIISLRMGVNSLSEVSLTLSTYVFIDTCNSNTIYQIILAQQSKAFRIIKSLVLCKKNPNPDVFSSILMESQAVAFKGDDVYPWVKYLATENKVIKNYESVVSYLASKKLSFIKTEYFDFEVLFLKAIFEIKGESKEFLVIIKQYDGSELTSIFLVVKDDELVKAMKSRKLEITMVDNLPYFTNEYAEFSILEPDNPGFVNYFYTPRDNEHYLDRLLDALENLICFSKIELEVALFDKK